jgi:NMD protein affecting ribosome stability and mRNA decay
MSNKFQLVCPKCGYPHCCGCSEWCKKQIPEGIKPYTWTDDGDAMICPNCGFIGSSDFWLDEELRQLANAHVEWAENLLNKGKR